MMFSSGGSTPEELDAVSVLAAKAQGAASSKAQEAEMHRIPKPPEGNRRGRARKVNVMVEEKGER
jgi:hypothetical protein